MDNWSIAERLRQQARSLAAQSANLYRVRAYRYAADVMERLPCAVSDLLRQRGRSGLAELPGVGDHLAFAIESLVTTGELVTWDERPRLLRAPGRIPAVRVRKTA
jgi:DNA polymerase (family X)